MSQHLHIGVHVLGARGAVAFESSLSDEELAEQALGEAQEIIERQVMEFPQAAPRALPSPLDGVSDQQWTTFVDALKVAPLDAVSDSGALGQFAIKPRRLEDIGIMKNVQPTNNKKKGGARSWQGDWVKGLTQAMFLGEDKTSEAIDIAKYIQQRALVASMQLYTGALADGEIEWPDVPDLTLSGGLAILQKCGPKGLEKWSNVDTRTQSAEELVSRANGIF